MIPPIITIDNKLYKLIRPVRDYQGMDAGALRELYGASHSFKKEGIVYFVDEIPDLDAEYTEKEECQ
jgi:hypothetical protein